MTFTIVISQVGPDWYRAQCQSLPGCIAHGSTAQEAADEMMAAMRGYLASLDMAEPIDLEVQLAGCATC